MAEYIAREALTKRLTRNLNACNPGTFSEGCYADAIETVKHFPAADVEPVRRWIPCSEGLPNDFEDVLCWYEYFRFGSFNRMFRKCGVGYQVNGHWGGEVSTGRNAKVLAWMPLPEPPEMDGGAGNG